MDCINLLSRISIFCRKALYAHSPFYPRPFAFLYLTFSQRNIHPFWHQSNFRKSLVRVSVLGGWPILSSMQSIFHRQIWETQITVGSISKACTIYFYVNLRKIYEDRSASFEMQLQILVSRGVTWNKFHLLLSPTKLFWNFPFHFRKTLRFTAGQTLWKRFVMESILAASTLLPSLASLSSTRIFFCIKYS